MLGAISIVDGSRRDGNLPLSDIIITGYSKWVAFRIEMLHMESDIYVAAAIKSGWHLMMWWRQSGKYMLLALRRDAMEQNESKW
jgi:hypothetical protein